MPYDGRIDIPSGSFGDPLLSRSQHSGSIELGPWEVQTPEFPEDPRTYRSTDELIQQKNGWPFPLSPGPEYSRTYQNTDELIRYENSWPFQSSPAATPSSSRRKDARVGPWKGWQLGARLCIFAVAAVFVLNIAVTAWALLTFGLDGGIGTIHRGTCSSIKHTGLWVHIAINVLSSILLGASNYCMQCLCSPTRREVDKAHAQSRWLDIGIQSVRNLTKISRLRMVLWLALAASSIPLHLMFNSAIFVSLTANEYTVATVTKDFVQGGNWSYTGPSPTIPLTITQMQQNLSSYEKLDLNTCFSEYGVDFVSSRKHVMAVVTDSIATNSLIGVLEWTYGTPKNSWICSTSLGTDMRLDPQSLDTFDCSVPVAIANNSFIMADLPVEYCLSERVPDICRLQIAVPIMIAVLCCNLLKLICMVITIFCIKERTFVTLGDALDDWLERPDLYTRGMCIATKEDFTDEKWPQGGPVRWVEKNHFRFEAAGTRRWMLSNTVGAASMIGASVLLRYAIHETTTSSDITTLYRLGFGTVTASSLIRWENPMVGSHGLLKNVLLANSPQLVLSLLYIMYNRMYTCMSFAKEWNDFGHHRRPLRVTSPRGAQRETYFLSLPYRYLIPVLSISVTAHWILSQSLFLVSVDVFDVNGNLQTGRSILTCGFSCIALIFLVGIGWLAFIAGVGLGLRRYKGGVPLAGSCSAALSAACHSLASETDTALVPVRWGVVSIEKGVGHCALSGRYVSPPITWRLYQGKPK